MLSLRHDLDPDCDDHIKGVAGHQVHETRTCPGSVCPTVILRWELQCTSVVLRREATSLRLLTGLLGQPAACAQNKGRHLRLWL